MKYNKIEKTFVLLGLLLITVALCLTGYNLYTDYTAGKTAANVLDELNSRPFDTNEIPDYISNPYMDMPVVNVDGVNYIGRIDVPSLDISLPVIGEWSYPLLKQAPCLYEGSAYLKNMIIMGHNYRTHFSPLKKIKVGDVISFTDNNDNVFNYTVESIEILNNIDVKEMSEGEWDLTLFTCEASGKMRFTVRCNSIE